MGRGELKTVEGWADRDEEYARYLLGDLPEAERVRLEEEYFTDDEAFERLLAVRDELVDLHARGGLSGRRRRRFEEYFLSTAPRRQRAREAKELIEFSTRVAAAKGATAVRERGAPRWSSLLGALGRRSPALRFASAALLLFAALGAVWLLARRGGDMQTERAAATPTPAPEIALRRPPDGGNLPPPESGAAGSVTPSPAPPASPPARTPGAANPPPKPPAAPAPRAAGVASIHLAPVLTRGEGPSNTLLIRPDTGTARLRLTFQGDDYRRYVAVLRTIEGEQVWRGAALEARSQGAGKLAVASVPVRAFRRKDHTVTLYGVTAAGELQEINEYFFTVDKGESR